MKIKTLLFPVMAVGLGLGVAAHATSFPTRADVSASVAAACASSNSDCLGEVKKWVDLDLRCEPNGANRQTGCGCAGSRLNLPHGVSDAMASIGISNAHLADRIRDEVSRTASACFASGIDFTNPRTSPTPEGGSRG